LLILLTALLSSIRFFFEESLRMSGVYPEPVEGTDNLLSFSINVNSFEKLARLRLIGYQATPKRCYAQASAVISLPADLSAITLVTAEALCEG
jgi:hypothetical protein